MFPDGIKFGFLFGFHYGCIALSSLGERAGPLCVISQYPRTKPIQALSRAVCVSSIFCVNCTDDGPVHVYMGWLLGRLRVMLNTVTYKKKDEPFARPIQLFWEE